MLEASFSESGVFEQGGPVDFYQGTVLRIDLTRSTAWAEPLNMEWAERYLGGKGLLLRYMWEYVPRKVDPFAPENPVLLVTGPFAGTNVSTASRLVVGAKSPATGLLDDNHELMLISQDGTVIRLSVEDIRTTGRNTMGVRVMNLRGADKVSSMARLVANGNGNGNAGGPRVAGTIDTADTDDYADTGDFGDSDAGDGGDEVAIEGVEEVDVEPDDAFESDGAGED